MKKLTVVTMMLLIATACASKKIDFNESARLDGENVKNPDSKELNCGDPSFIANYTNTDSKFGTLEVTNTGVCKVTVTIAEDAGGGRVRKIGDPYDVEARIGNITAFPMTENKKLTLEFKCQASSAAGKCQFSYKFSTGKESKTPSKEFLGVDDSPSLTPKGQPLGQNQCVTLDGEEPIVKVISNLLKAGELRVDFTAKSNCTCKPFTVFAVDPKNKKDANADPNGTNDGMAIVPAGGKISLKAKCGSGSLATETCKGVIQGIKVSITTK